MVLMAAIAAILIVSHCSEPPWNIWWLDFKNIWVDLKSPLKHSDIWLNPKRGGFWSRLRHLNVKILSTVPGIGQQSSYSGVKLVKPFCLKPFCANTGFAGIVKIFLHFCPDFCTFCRSSLIRTGWEACWLFLIDGFTPEREGRWDGGENKTAQDKVYPKVPSSELRTTYSEDFPFTRFCRATFSFDLY